MQYMYIALMLQA